MNILHILDERWDSGITNYGINLAKGLKLKKHNVYAACLPGSPAFNQAKKAGLEIIVINGVSKCLTLRSFVRAKKIEVIHTHTGSGNFLGFLAGSSQTKLVRSRGDIRPPKTGILARYLVKNTAHIICAAKFIADDFKRAFPECPGRKISVIYQGIEPRKETLKNQDVPKDALNVGIIGRLDPVKGHNVFVRAARIMLEHFPNTKFYIAGREANLKWVDVLDTAKRLSISKSFVYCGYVDSAYDFMDKMHIGVIASLGSEAISRAALEWMASGKALLSSTAGCLGELVENNIDGLLYQAGSHEALARQMLTLANSPQKISLLGKFAAEKIKNKFSLDSFISNTEKIYNAL